MTYCAKAKGSKFYAMGTCLETGHAQQDGVWWTHQVCWGETA